MAGYAIPFNRPDIAGTEFRYVEEAVRNMHFSGDGPFTARCRDLLQGLLGAECILLTPSGTAALEMAAILLDVGEGDEVVLPSFTFVSTANAFALRGARPVFADIRPDTLNLDEERLESLLSPKTKAVVPVHYAGVACAMDPILERAGRRGVPVVEDNAHGLFGTYKGRPLGTLGALGILSFHETKNISCGEGGALIVNDAALIERAEIIREKGTNRKKFFRGEVDKYSWVDIGSSFLLSDLLAAFLYAQLERREDIRARRKRIYDTYARELGGWAAANGVGLPAVPPHCDPSYHMFHLLLPSAGHRSRFIAHMKERGILCVFHYVPLHTSEMGRRFGGRAGDCPVVEDVSARLVRLPFFNALDPADQARVIEGVLAFCF